MTIIFQDSSGRQKNQNGKGWKDSETSYTLNTVERQGVLVTQKSTSTPNKFIKPTSLTTKTMETSQKSTKKNYQTLTSWWADFPANLFLSQGTGEALMIQEGRCSLNSLGLLKKNSHAFLCLRTLKGYYLTTKGEHLLPSSPRLMSWGMTVNGRCLTAKITESPKTGSECSLSDILEEHVDPQVFPFIGESGKDFKISPDKLIEYSARHETRMYDKVAPTVQSAFGTGGGHVPFVNGIRKLTPTECERLQGFPDGWTTGISDTQRYKTLGNAVTVNVIEDIFTKILFGDN